MAIGRKKDLAAAQLQERISIIEVKLDAVLALLEAHNLALQALRMACERLAIVIAEAEQHRGEAAEEH